MPKSPSHRAISARGTSIRGLSPGAVFIIAACIMLCGFAVADRQGLVIGEEPVVANPILVESIIRAAPLTPAEERAFLLSDENKLYDATLWLARCVYSETGQRHEQELVAWVVRNRVETRYRGESTYAGVVIDPFQFSAFNRTSITREFLLAVDSTYTSRQWNQALDVAREVILAESGLRPFPITTRHFYSERSLGDADVPLWADEIEPITVHPYLVDEKRFRFFDRVS